MKGGAGRAEEKEKKADFLVDYKRFTPRVTKAFTGGGIVHVETRIEATLFLAAPGTVTGSS